MVSKMTKGSMVNETNTRIDICDFFDCHGADGLWNRNGGEYQWSEMCIRDSARDVGWIKKA